MCLSRASATQSKWSWLQPELVAPGSNCICCHCCLGQCDQPGWAKLNPDFSSVFHNDVQMAPALDEHKCGTCYRIANGFRLLQCSVYFIMHMKYRGYIKKLSFFFFFCGVPAVIHASLSPISSCEFLYCFTREVPSMQLSTVQQQCGEVDLNLTKGTTLHTANQLFLKN